VGALPRFVAQLFTGGCKRQHSQEVHALRLGGMFHRSQPRFDNFPMGFFESHGLLFGEYPVSLSELLIPAVEARSS